MSSKPAVRRTYGRLPPRPESSFMVTSSPPPLSSPLPLFMPSSPSSFVDLQTPHPSSPTPKERSHRALFSPPSSPLLDPAEDHLIPALRLDATPNDVSLEQIKAAPPRPKQAVQSSLKGFFAPLPQKRKRPLQPTTTIPSSSSTSVAHGQRKTTKSTCNTQMRLTHLPLLHTCDECQMSFMRGGEDEALHHSHHTRVMRGIPWDGLGKGKGRAADNDVGWRVIKENVSFGPATKGKTAAKGRIIVADGSWGGNKLTEILSLVDVVLSAPALSPAILDRCKIFLFLTSSPPPPRQHNDGKTKRPRIDITAGNKSRGGGERERIISIVVAQGIKWAMKVLGDGELVSAGICADGNQAKTIESGGLGSVTCDSTPLPTPLGIHRLYTIPSYRTHSLHTHLLDAACAHTVYGCTFSPSRGEVAFSQPTESGRKVMCRWGSEGEGIRVFVDDESQL